MPGAEQEGASRRPPAVFRGPVLDKAIRFREDWVNQTSYRGRWRETVRRSAIPLKLLTSQRYGATIAAATFGLPEEVGGERNWDYRYAWVRDTAFTMYAFLQLGFREEARAFIHLALISAALQLGHMMDGGGQSPGCVSDAEGWQARQGRADSEPRSVAPLLQCFFRAQGHAPTIILPLSSPARFAPRRLSHRQEVRQGENNDAHG